MPSKPPTNPLADWARSPGGNRIAKGFLAGTPLNIQPEEAGTLLGLLFGIPASSDAAAGFLQGMGHLASHPAETARSAARAVRQDPGFWGGSLLPSLLSPGFGPYGRGTSVLKQAAKEAVDPSLHAILPAGQEWFHLGSHWLSRFSPRKDLEHGYTYLARSPERAYKAATNSKNAMMRARTSRPLNIYTGRPGDNPDILRLAAYYLQNVSDRGGFDLGFRAYASTPLGIPRWPAAETPAFMRLLRETGHVGTLVADEADQSLAILPEHVSRSLDVVGLPRQFTKGWQVGKSLETKSSYSKDVLNKALDYRNAAPADRSALSDLIHNPKFLPSIGADAPHLLDPFRHLIDLYHSAPGLLTPLVLNQWERLFRQLAQARGAKPRPSLPDWLQQAQADEYTIQKRLISQTPDPIFTGGELPPLATLGNPSEVLTGHLAGKTTSKGWLPGASTGVEPSWVPMDTPPVEGWEEALLDAATLKTPLTAPTGASTKTKLSNLAAGLQDLSEFYDSDPDLVSAGEWNQLNSALAVVQEALDNPTPTAFKKAFLASAELQSYPTAYSIMHFGPKGTWDSHPFPATHMAFPQHIYSQAVAVALDALPPPLPTAIAGNLGYLKKGLPATPSHNPAYLKALTHLNKKLGKKAAPLLQSIYENMGGTP